MYTLGIDIGSSSSKIALLNKSQTLLSSAVVTGGAGTSGPDRVIAEIFDKTGLTWHDIDRTVATGYGRMGFSRANKQVSEISCHALGVHHFVPAVKTIIDIGGQDVKALSLTATGHVASFLMNDKCAAGTGRFLDVMARILEIDVSELGDVAKRAETLIDISNTCTVFAESEVISRLAAGVKKADIAAGIHQSVARRVASLAFRVGVKPDVVLTGGVAQNSGIVSALSKEVHHPVIVAPNCQLTGAIGAALIGLQDLLAETELKQAL